MTKDEWKKIVAAKNLLGLADAATLAEIKSAYRRCAKKHHPDRVRGEGLAGDEPVLEMHRLTEAYQLLMAHCARHRIPLVPGDGQPLEGEDWWMERFGDDPLWSPGRK